MDRLRSAKEISKVFKKGKRIRGRYINVLFLCSFSPNESRIAFAIGRQFGNAVKRNAMRRLIKETIRNYPFPKAYDLVIEVLPKANQLTNEQRKSSLIQLIGKSCQVLKNPQNSTQNRLENSH